MIYQYSHDDNNVSSSDNNIICRRVTEVTGLLAVMFLKFMIRKLLLSNCTL